MKKLSVNQIQNKKFNIVYKGYKVEEVNDFLDEIIKDYVCLENQITSLNDQLELANLKIAKLTTDKQQTETELDQYVKKNWKLVKDNLNDVDVIKRITRIEKNLVEYEEKLNKIDEIYKLLINKLR
ncbi:DivIVA domain-containing protein [Mycoplasma feriruminatoris]|uniref:Cell cycle protein GpsB n=1 Tax=Mycoplasma feriruminatoris TaxID=1179777 RepID=A0AAQ3DN03_9MOLU|nr:DivIVA domain-containing protein [Mycoplasma feriruminatoris]UKS54199.1 divIVA domain protein [Mycoplasma feriruminatoris]WFQ90257.1 Cell cycle protein GpsB [Mycoplasma feriruminatoris]WFQ91080.1 DivIVA domain-containing protein [Mycoplasma feriruminatoris]WFQ91902.1 Cell cycle protein GpsB [Mycoplasma feriruminatoris]WFQ92742.1 Cell cycle protein GpsB [Mycoplasma feriruminatoris]